MNRQIARKCDMGGGVKLRLLLEEDGDVLVSVMKETDRVAFDAVEFCASGTNSPRTQCALHELYRAMQQDEEERPQEL